MSELIISSLLAAAIAVCVISGIFILIFGVSELLRWTRFSWRYKRARKELDERYRRTGHF